MKIYMDVCCFNRPFDDKELLRITKRLKLGIKTVNPLNWFMEVYENE